ncbi:MAG: tripartite tricarboxylate transporter substrate binding protein [Betaproteobacteria bacterium]|nr:tripartite tricarboxylate transporter substrate binding protein [Betaproteobacteria bacterium]
MTIRALKPQLSSNRGRVTRWRAVAALIACVWTGLAFGAEEFPTRTMRMVIPFPAGGPADFVGRLYSQHLTDLWGQQVVIDNRSGASGIIGTDAAVRSNPDGYTLLFGAGSSLTIIPILMKNLPYDVFRDLSLIGLVANAPHVLAVRVSLPAKSVKELVAMAKQQPGKYTFATSGTGGVVHMAGELFKYHAGIDILHVPFKGGAPATVALLAGEVDMMVNDLSAVLVHVKSGKLLALAASHTRRLAPLPNTPTFSELGMPGIVSSTWWAIAVPVKTPAAVQARIVTAHNKVLARPGYIERLSDLAMEPLVLTPEQTAAFIKREIDMWQKVVTATNVRID